MFSKISRWFRCKFRKVCHPEKDWIEPDFNPAEFTFNREARWDKMGRLKVYNLPKGDGGGSFEVAGITERYQPELSLKLKKLIEEGDHKYAETLAKDFFRHRASKFIKHTDNKGLQLQLSDTVHHRGEGGLIRVLQIATSMTNDNYAILISRLSGMSTTLARFNQARIEYEMKEIDRGRDSRKKFRKGLMNRFAAAHKAAVSANIS